MSFISKTIESLVAQQVQASQAQASAVTQQSSVPASTALESFSGGFGNAVNVDLSSGGQAIANGTSSVSGVSSASGSAAAPAGGAPGIAVSSTTSSDVETLIEEAKRKIIPEVGVKGADEVVDNQGNINQVKLNELLVQQALTQSSRISITA